MGGIHSAQSPTAGQVSTASEVDIVLEPTRSDGNTAIFAARGIGSIAFQCWNSGANTINGTVYASNDADEATALWIDRSGTALDALAAASASAKAYVETAPGFSFYKLTVQNAAGVGTIHVRITQQGA